MKANKILLTLLITIWGCIILLFFYHVHSINYKKHGEIQESLIKHPEFLPSSQSLEIISFGFQKLVADIYWLKAVQYIGSNVLSEAYKKYLYTLLNLVTDIDPYFTKAYVIGQLLLPEDRPHVSEELHALYNSQAIKLGKKGIKASCDLEKIERISQESNLQKLLNSEIYVNPCIDYKIPYYQAFTQYFYLKNYEEAAKYYKVVSAQNDAPNGARTLTAIMTGRAWSRETSIKMFLSLAQNIQDSDESCKMLSTELKTAYQILSSQKIWVPADLVKELNIIAKSYTPELTIKNENEIFQKTKCVNYLLKSIRELNLLYLEEGMQRYLTDGWDLDIITKELLLSKGYIKLIPEDYQRYSDANQWIIYFYDQEAQRFDYTMSLFGEK